MAKPLIHVSDIDRSVTLAIRVTPRARKNEISQILADGTIKIHLTSPPLEGRANAALVKFVADVLQVPSNCVEILIGESGRNKIIKVNGMAEEVVNQRIQEALSKTK
jgi:hypothetical protein